MHAWTSENFAFTLIEKAGVVVIRGGMPSDNRGRVIPYALVKPAEVLREVVSRIKDSEYFLGKWLH
jgi:LL-diaminopimelate aminotransferase